MCHAELARSLLGSMQRAVREVLYVNRAGGETLNDRRYGTDRRYLGQDIEIRMPIDRE